MRCHVPGIRGLGSSTRLHAPRLWRPHLALVRLLPKGQELTQGCLTQSGMFSKMSSPLVVLMSDHTCVAPRHPSDKPLSAALGPAMHTHLSLDPDHHSLQATPLTHWIYRYAYAALEWIPSPKRTLTLVK